MPDVTEIDVRVEVTDTDTLNPLFGVHRIRFGVNDDGTFRLVHHRPPSNIGTLSNSAIETITEVRETAAIWMENQGHVVVE